MYFLHWKGSFQMKNQEPLENEACFMLPASLVTHTSALLSVVFP